MVTDQQSEHPDGAANVKQGKYTKESAGGSGLPPRWPPSASTPHHNARRRSRHMYAAVIVGLCVLLVWAISRLALCWGDYGRGGEILCHSQWATFASLVAGVVAFWFLVLDLSEPHMDSYAGRRMRRSRAAWHGYLQLERRAFIHTTASTLLLLGSIVGFLWLILLGPVRF